MMRALTGVRMLHKSRGGERFLKIRGDWSYYKIHPNYKLRIYKIPGDESKLKRIVV